MHGLKRPNLTVKERGANRVFLQKLCQGLAGLLLLSAVVRKPGEWHLCGRGGSLLSSGEHRQDEHGRHPA